MIDTDYFSLFGLPRSFDLDSVELERAWKKVALAVHPDKFATASAAEKRVAMQWSTRANEAYTVLRQPLARARYLCELAGIDLEIETNTAMSSEFLLQQMEWHELLDDIVSSTDFTRKALLESELLDSLSEHIDQCAALFRQGDFKQAAIKIREWMFLEKMMAQLRASLPQT